MSRPAVLTVEARADLRAELRWIGPDGLATAKALRDAVFDAARRLGERPMLGRRQLELLPEPYRFWSLTRFQVVLVYDAAARPPRVLRILNTARDFVALLAGLHEAADPEASP